MAVSFDLFGTLVAVDRATDPAVAVADELRERGVRVPDDWSARYRESHVDAPEGAEVPLPAHVARVLASCGIDAPENAARRAVVSAFDPEVRTREAATTAVEAASRRGPVAVCSNCAVPELARRALIRSDVDPDAFDAVVTSVGCGWRKPDARIFGAVADRLGVEVSSLVHVGDDPRTDGGVTGAGGTAVFLDCDPDPTDLDPQVGEIAWIDSLSSFPDWLEGRSWV